MTVYSLKSGKTYTSPSLFVNARTHLDVAALWNVVTKNNLTHIDGIYVSLSDYKQIFSKLGFLNQPLDQMRNTIREKVFLVDPSIDNLSSTADVRQKMFATGCFDKQILRKIRDINSSNLTKGKASIMLDEVYSQIHVKPLMDMQVNANADMIIAPCIPINRKTRLMDRITLARDMLKDARTLLETSSLKQHKDRKDLMNVVVLSKSIILDDANFSRIFDLLLCNRPDHVGIKIDRIGESDTVEQISLFKFFQEFRKYAQRKTGNDPPPMHFINVNELGYVGYCHAVSNIICPIRHTPVYSFNRRYSSKISATSPPDTATKYYHPIDMSYQNFELQNPFPCACNVCNKHQYAKNVPRKNWPMHNRNHWLEVKDGEIKELRETPARLDVALRDKFARSNRTQLIAYLPTSPIFVH